MPETPTFIPNLTRYSTLKKPGLQPTIVVGPDMRFRERWRATRLSAIRAQILTKSRRLAWLIVFRALLRDYLPNLL